MSEQLKSVTVDKPIPVNYDLGNLAVSDPNPLDHTQISNAQAKEKYLTSVTRDNVQLLINQVLSLPLKQTTDGEQSSITLISLPEPLMQVPREKEVPKPREPTRWELFASKKGIKKKGKDTKLTYDEATGEWKNKWGYKGKNKELDDQWLVEVDEVQPKSKKGAVENEEGLIDPRKLSRDERKKLIKRNLLQQKRNLKK